jgi:hypothetical protein
MSASPFGMVLEGNTDFDKAKVDRHLSITKPLSMTVVNNHQYALHLKRNVIPATDIFIRNVDLDGDGNDHEQYMPDSYWEKYYPLTDNGALGLQFGNEGTFSPEVANQKLLPFMRKAVETKTKISIPGVAVGNTPGSREGWAVYHPFVEYACNHRDFVVVDVHEYYLALPTSGMITAQTQPGDSLYFAQHLRTEEQWRHKTLADFTNNYHVGRIRWLFDYARSKNLPAPVVDLGEFGADFVKDNPVIEAWARAIKATNALNIEGYQTLRDYWQIIFPQWTHQQAYFEHLKWLIELLKEIGVRSTRLFLWTMKRWPTFNLAGDAALQLWLETYLPEPSIPTPPVPPVISLPPFPFDFDIRSREGLLSSAEPRKLRMKPQLESPMLTTIQPNTRALYIPAGNLRPDEKVMSNVDGSIAPWQPVIYAGARGWLWTGGVTWKDIPALPPDVSLIALKEIRIRLLETAESIGRMGLQLATYREEITKDMQLLDAVISSREKTNMEVQS